MFGKKMLPNIRPITNIRHRAENIRKMSFCIWKTNCFLRWQLKSGVDGHELCASETYTHNTVTMSTNTHNTLTKSTKSIFSREKIAWKWKGLFFSFRQHLTNICFGRILGRKRIRSITSWNYHYLLCLTLMNISL
jgi:hypothetical protein